MDTFVDLSTKAKMSNLGLGSLKSILGKAKEVVRVAVDAGRHCTEWLPLSKGGQGERSHARGGWKPEDLFLVSNWGAPSAKEAFVRKPLEDPRGSETGLYGHPSYS
ncbi:hypothetical protein H1C71_003761 [Ictidomys tridecemlineatus]|nr:hypothetical protein H1C71_003761 [Ictidomys tridecemlineatus]